MKFKIKSERSGGDAITYREEYARKPRLVKAFVYIPAAELHSVALKLTVKRLSRQAQEVGASVVETFLDSRKSSGDLVSSPILVDLIDVLWRNDGSLLFVGAPESLLGDAVFCSYVSARVDAAHAKVIYISR